MFSHAPQPPTFPSAHPHRPYPQPTSFISPPSRLVTHQSPANTCSFSHPRNLDPSNPTSPGKPLTTLLLSLPLARKIHYLILASRQIESLARGWFAGSIPPAEAERRMSLLEEQYDSLREDVECELESAWVNAGYLPADLAAFPASSRVPGAEAVRPQVPTTGILEVKKNAHVGGLKRKLDTAPSFPAKKVQSRAAPPVLVLQPIQTHYSSDRSSTDDERGVFELPKSPVGLRVCMVPLNSGDKQRMGSFEWKKAGRGRVGAQARKVAADGCVSPRGGVYSAF